MLAVLKKAGGQASGCALKEVNSRRSPACSAQNGKQLDWFENAPRIRVKNPNDKKRDAMMELAAVNERLAGTQPWQARRKLEYLKSKKVDWEQINDYVSKHDTIATLALIEEAAAKVESALSEGARDTNSVASLGKKLMELQREVDEAHKKLQATQATVEANLQRINDLQAEAERLERTRLLTAAPATVTVAPAAVELERTAMHTVKPAMDSVAARSQKKNSKGLESTLEIEAALRNFWYPAEFSNKLGKDVLIPFDIFGEPWVLFRDEHGQPACVRDECAHRACPLSLGTVVDGHVQCPYHGWQFSGSGQCTKMPSTVHNPNVRVSALPCFEKDGFVWVWPGKQGELPEVPDFTKPPEGFEVHAEIMVDVPVEHGLLMENLLDLAHAPFTHTTTFARGWPIPDAVKFHASKMLSGNWDPYPIGMSFQPPCMVVSMIGLAQPGKIERGVKAEQCKRHLHQLHVCMPSKPGHTRLLYRMSLDFMNWVKYVPGIQSVWKNVAGQVLGEDLVLVKGQQERMMAGRDTWQNPVSYDKLAVRYRRWRNAFSAGEVDEAGARVAIHGDLTGMMSSGELFSVDEQSAAPTTKQ